MEGFGFCGVSLRFVVAKFPERTPDQRGVLDADQSNALFFLICETYADAVGHH